MNPLENATISKLEQAGINLSGYTNPVVTPAPLLRTMSDVILGEESNENEVEVEE